MSPEAARHGRALRVRLRIAALIALAAGVLFLPIEVYFGPAADRRPLLSTGLVGIRERVRILGGTMTIHGRPGTRLRIAVPLHGGEAGAR